jgi:hypothetical protein
LLKPIKSGKNGKINRKKSNPNVIKIIFEDGMALAHTFEKQKYGFF